VNRFVLPQVSQGERSQHVLPGTDVVIEMLPKVSLHDHLDGGVRPQTIIDLATNAGIDLPADDARALGEWFRTQADSGSLPDYLATFEVTLAVMQTSANLERIAGEFVDDLVADGVVYAEIRWAPELHGVAGLSLDDAVDSVQRGIEGGIARAEKAGRPIRVGQLLCAMRHTDRALEIVGLAGAQDVSMSGAASAAEERVLLDDVVAAAAAATPAAPSLLLELFWRPHLRPRPRHVRQLHGVRHRVVLRDLAAALVECRHGLLHALEGESEGEED
jgi:hypothetical protein